MVTRARSGSLPSMRASRQALTSNRTSAAAIIRVRTRQSILNGSVAAAIVSVALLFASCAPRRIDGTSVETANDSIRAVRQRIHDKTADEVIASAAALEQEAKNARTSWSPA